MVSLYRSSVMMLQVFGRYSSMSIQKEQLPKRLPKELPQKIAQNLTKATTGCAIFLKKTHPEATRKNE